MKTAVASIATAIMTIIFPILYIAPANATIENVSIVMSAATKTTDAFSPNPIRIDVGDVVTWVNDDSQPHTITSGTGPDDINKGKEFDTSPNLNPLFLPGKTFSHTFTQPGTFEYFCQLHPNMVGTVQVAAATTTASPPAVEGEEQHSASAAQGELQSESSGRSNTTTAAEKLAAVQTQYQQALSRLHAADKYDTPSIMVNARDSMTKTFITNIELMKENSSKTTIGMPSGFASWIGWTPMVVVEDGSTQPVEVACPIPNAFPVAGGYISAPGTQVEVSMMQLGIMNQTAGANRNINGWEFIVHTPAGSQLGAAEPFWGAVLCIGKA